MIPLPDLFTRMQTGATGCVALLTVRVEDGAVMDSCGASENLDAVAGVMRDLFAQKNAAEWILLAEERTYVCQRSQEQPDLAVTVICESARNLGLVVGLLRKELG